MRNFIRIPKIETIKQVLKPKSEEDRGKSKRKRKRKAGSKKS